MTVTLHELFRRSAAAHPENVAVEDPARRRTISYARLDRLTDDLAVELRELGVGSGHRVGICAPKSIGAVASILATLKAGAAYVPVDIGAPLGRSAGILSDCDVTATFVERSRAEALAQARGQDVRLAEVDGLEDLSDWGTELELLVSKGGSPSRVPELAYVLYTSGSTGTPKGVMHTHSSARCFVEWCSRTFQPVPLDRFSSHAPFHFDLSILDLYVPLAHGAAVVLIGEEEGKNPLRLGPLISESEISVWYSTPSVLRLLIEHGGLERYAPVRLRLVLFAGEVFAPGHLRRLQQAWPSPRYFNLYGPTETNVCTAYEVIGQVPADRVEPYPIGRPITGDETIVVDSDDRPVAHGAEGELLVHGGTVMTGYWNRPELDTTSFHLDENGRKWYRTGDIVKKDAAGDYVFLGRRDRMIKRRGYRVELGEIEAALYRHPKVREAAVVAMHDPNDGVSIRAYMSWRDEKPGSTIELRKFCTENLPLYMMPDSFAFLPQLPKTSTDKIDYVRVKGL